MKYKANGFTLIELILSMAMLAVIGLMTVPHFVAAAEEANAQAKWDISIAAKDSRIVLTAQTGSVPTVKSLASTLPGIKGTAVSGGIQVKIDGENLTIPTYTNSLCNEPTKDVNEKVRCVGSIAS